MKRSPIPGCLWAADNLLVRTGNSAQVALTQALLKDTSDAGVVCAVNLLSKEEYLEAGADALFCPSADALAERSDDLRRDQPQVFMSYVFWPEPGDLPSARQVRQAIDSLEDAHALGLRVLVNGVGHPARAALLAGCWLAREGYGGDLESQRLAWLEDAHKPGAGTAPSCELSVAERIFVSEWPTGREGQPELVDMEWSDRDEVFPFAPVEHWLRVLPTVRVYPGTRGRVRPVDVPVVRGQRVSDDANIDLHLEELRRGTWIGERTLRLTHGWEVVFIGTARS